MYNIQICQWLFRHALLDGEVAWNFFFGNFDNKFYGAKFIYWLSTTTNLIFSLRISKLRILKTCRRNRNHISFILGTVHVSIISELSFLFFWLKSILNFRIVGAVVDRVKSIFYILIIRWHRVQHYFKLLSSHSFEIPIHWRNWKTFTDDGFT